MGDIDQENFIMKLTDAAKNHDEWLSIIRFGLEQLLKNQALLFEVMSREASRIVERKGVSDFVTATAMTQIFIELKLRLVILNDGNCLWAANWKGI